MSSILFVCGATLPLRRFPMAILQSLMIVVAAVPVIASAVATSSDVSIVFVLTDPLVF